MQRHGVHPVNPKDAECWLVTVSSAQGRPAVKHMLRKYGGAGKQIVIGGGGCYAPAVFDDLATVCCVGEGVNFLDVLFSRGMDAAMQLPEAWVPGETRPVVPSQSFPWDIPPIMHPDGKVRIFESRGCKHKCLFCQTGWERRYIDPTDPASTIAKCNELYEKHIPYDLVTNDAGHTDIANNVKGLDAISIRCDALNKVDIARLPKTVRIGVEGVSARLRSAVKKAITWDMLLSSTEKLCAHGKAVKWFFICGLPCEAEADYQELDYAASQLRRFKKGVVQAVFHAFIPQPATPLCVFPVKDEYWEPFDSWRTRFFDGGIHSNRLQIVAPAQYKTRLKHSCLSMAAAEEEVRRGWWEQENRNWRIQYLLSPEKLRAVAGTYAKALKF